MRLLFKTLDVATMSSLKMKLRLYLQFPQTIVMGHRLLTVGIGILSSALSLQNWEFRGVHSEPRYQIEIYRPKKKPADKLLIVTRLILKHKNWTQRWLPHYVSPNVYKLMIFWFTKFRRQFFKCCVILKSGKAFSERKKSRCRGKDQFQAYNLLKSRENPLFSHLSLTDPFKFVS